LPHLQHSSAPALFAYATFLPRFTFAPVDVRFGSKADIGLASVDVRFTPKSGHQLSASSAMFDPLVPPTRFDSSQCDRDYHEDQKDGFNITHGRTRSAQCSSARPNTTHAIAIHCAVILAS
jgi:hypothetical protein